MQLFHLSDTELIRLYLDGNDTAFEVLLKRHKDQVYAKIRFMVKDESLANDLFQDTFLKVINTVVGAQ